MTAHHPDELIRAFIAEGREELPDRAFDAVRGDIHRTRQRVVIGPWREPQMSNLAKVALAAAAVIAVAFGASRLLPTNSGPGTIQPSPTPSPTVTATETPTPTATGAFGGIAHYGTALDPSTTEVDAVAIGESISGTAVTTSRSGTHTVRLECADRDGNTWVLGGTTEKSTVPGEPAGTWSAVLVRDGSPQLIAIWLSGDPQDASNCEEWLALNDSSELPSTEFTPMESGELVPPPHLAP
jgi:hypothetical protein